MDLKTQTGIVTAIHYERGFGFILTEVGQEIFFHRSGTTDPFEDLKSGQEVEFLETQYVTKNQELRTRAIGITVV